jgi:hypothetical protein
MNRRDAMDAEKKLRLEMSAAIASLRFCWHWVLVAALPHWASAVEMRSEYLRRLR